MKLVRYGRPGREKPGMIDAQGQLRDLSGIVEFINQDILAPRELAKLKKIRPESLPMVKGTPRLGVPYTGISKIVAIGLNYRDHAEEGLLAVGAVQQAGDLEDGAAGGDLHAVLTGEFDDGIAARKRPDDRDELLDGQSDATGRS